MFLYFLLKFNLIQDRRMKILFLCHFPAQGFLFNFLANLTIVLCRKFWPLCSKRGLQVFQKNLKSLTSVFFEYRIDLHFSFEYKQLYSEMNPAKLINC